MLKVLLVDDDFIVRRGMCEAIDWQSLDCEVVADVGDGEEALEAIPLHEPDVVFCDVVMPRMDGLALLSEVTQRWPWVKMVMVSAHDEANYVRQALQHDAVDYLVKPFHERDVARVLQAVRKKLSRERVTLSTEALENPQVLLDIRAHVGAILDALRAADDENAVLEIRALFYAIRAGGMQSRLFVNSLVIELVMEVLKLLQQYGAEEEAQRIADRLGLLTRYALLEDLEEGMVQLIGGLAGHIHRVADPTARLVARARELIERHFDRNITVTDLAGQLHVSGNHLQKLFKQEAGHTIRQHLITVRMERAKELLLRTREKVYAIGEAVGYQDPDFFTQTFVKATGMTPQQYRETQG